MPSFCVPQSKFAFWRALLCTGLLLGSALPEFAQRSNELTFGIGATVTPKQALKADASSISFDPSFAFTADYYHRFAGTKTAFYGGISFAASPLDVIVNSGPPAAIKQYAYLFLTPEIRVKFNAQSRVAPWLSLGGGYANFAEGALRNEMQNPNSGTNRGTFQFGGGVDVATPFVTPILWRVPLGLRLEVRDYFSGKPNYNLSTAGSLQHNVLFAAGIILRFR